MEFQLEDGTTWNRPDRGVLDQALRSLAPGSANSFAIFDLHGLVSGPEFIQAACSGDGFLIERRTQEPAHHYRGVRTGVAGGWEFTVEEVITAFHDFAYADARTPAFLSWEIMDDEVGL